MPQDSYGASELIVRDDDIDTARDIVPAALANGGAASRRQATRPFGLLVRDVRHRCDTPCLGLQWSRSTCVAHCRWYP
jgi:hypothetical protein